MHALPYLYQIAALPLRYAKYLGGSIYTATRSCRRNDHVGELGQQVITSTTDAFPPVQPVHPDERIGHLADLFRQLQQPHLGRDIFVIGIQLADLIPT